MVQNVKRTAGNTLRRVLHTTYDALDRGQRALPALVPPRQINPNIGFTPRRGDYAREFITSGDRVAAMLKTYGNLQPDQQVLDIGSGIGRIARALTTYLSKDGQYRGFDVDPRAVAWCQRSYGRLSNFLFAYAPVGYINVRGRGTIRGEDLVFPYPEATFDLAFSMSVYTHLSRATVDHYLGETSRVLRPGGMCLNTFFVMDDFAVEAMQSGRADRRYVRQGDGVYVADLDNPNFGIGFTPDVINTFHESHGLTIVPPIRFGGWTGRKLESFVYQDVVVARKGTASTEPSAPAEERR